MPRKLDGRRGIPGERQSSGVGAGRWRYQVHSLSLNPRILFVDHDLCSTADLTPIPITRSPITTPIPIPQDSTTIRKQVDNLAGSANKVITGVVDSSFGIIKSLLPINSPSPVTPTLDGLQVAAPWNAIVGRSGFGLLRRDSGFSIAGLSLVGSHKGGAERGEEELLEVSRPGSVRSTGNADDTSSEEEDEEGEEGDDVEGDEDEEEEEESDVGGYGGDTRSIRSFESMMSRSSGKKRKRRKKTRMFQKEDGPAGPRKSLTDRLARVSSGFASLKVCFLFLSFFRNCKRLTCDWLELDSIAIQTTVGHASRFGGTKRLEWESLRYASVFATCVSGYISSFATTRSSEPEIRRVHQCGRFETFGS